TIATVLVPAGAFEVCEIRHDDGTDWYTWGAPYPYVKRVDNVSICFGGPTTKSLASTDHRPSSMIASADEIRDLSPVIKFSKDKSLRRFKKGEIDLTIVKAEDSLYSTVIVDEATFYAVRLQGGALEFCDLAECSR